MPTSRPPKVFGKDQWLVQIPRGLIVSGEDAFMYLSRNFEPGKKPGIVYFAGKSAGAYNIIGAGFLQEMAIRGYPIICGDLGDQPAQIGQVTGPGVWGCDAALAKAELLRQWMASMGYSKAGTKVAVTGGSHGGIGCYAFARNYAANVSCVMSAIGTVDTEDIRANNRAGYQASIEGAAAYGSNANWQAARSTHNPVEVVAWLVANGKPCLDYYSTTDAICVPATHATLLANAGGESAMFHQVSMGAVGHSFQGVAPRGNGIAQPMNFDIADWLEGNM